MSKQLKILVAPLNWGLGHASRSSVIIQELLDRGHNVVIGADGKALGFLQDEFPTLKCIRIKDIDVHYKSGKTASFLNYLNIGLKILVSKTKEQQILQDIQKHEQFDVIISDNRYGLYLKGVYSVLLTHQLQIKTPFLSSFINKIISKYMGNFSAVWVPDFEESLLSGELSKMDVKNKKYVGPLSRFKYSKKEKHIDVLYLLSGPEPMRSLIEKNLPLTPSRGGEKIVLVRGTKNKAKIDFASNVKVIDFATKNELEDLINSSNKIVCTGGYSTIMDLFCMNTSALLIPTPHQWEQEYLVEYLTKKGWFNSTTLDELNLEKTIPVITDFPKENLLEKELNALETKLGEA